MLQNPRVTSFTVFELLRENQLEGAEGGGWNYTPPRSGLTSLLVKHLLQSEIHIYKQLLMKKQKSEQFVSLNHNELCFA